MRSAADTLDDMRMGAAAMVSNALGRLNECRTHIEEGEFEQALESAQALLDRVTNLAFAESRLAALASASLVRVPDLREGMRGQGGGRIVSIEPCECGLEGCDKLMVTFENGAVQKMDRTWEMLVLHD